MRTIKTAMILVGALLPIAYCGFLAIHFFNVGGSVEGVQEIGLGPTVIGLGIVGLLFCIPLLLKVVRLSSGPRAPGPRRGSDTPDDDGGADADAMIARYMAQRPVQPIANPAAGSSSPAKRAGFGRRV